eukprot:CAMPEP_0173434146 /NCGR_PEP_ID=MMETSP1357-20121228/12090_1 /TAXON_ID=77926 /ORGANISM="Hemiselmis rufescens, Strain PCC563" /LENGTH=83 /DNA_ID=CAMNT_0014398957 /DNA_START=23 /DNA_END=274 /DNA_ORIENTATION=-
MFGILAQTAELSAVPVNVNKDQYLGFVGIPKPPPGYMPPLGASSYTWPNIFKNMKRMDYCVDNFDFLGNRIKCINKFTGPLLD